jgi:spermidine/putrescine transport system substrate-binding protein
MGRAYPIETNPSRRAWIQIAGRSALGFAAAGIFSGCDKKESARMANGEKPLLRFHGSGMAIDREVLEKFEHQSKIVIEMESLSSDEQLLAKLTSGLGDFDLLRASNETVERLAADGFLATIDRSLIPNLKNLARHFRGQPFDPKLDWAIPVGFQVYGIAYRKSKVIGTPDSWQILFESDVNKGRIALLSHAATMFRLHAKYLRKSLNAFDIKDLRTIEAMMVRQKPNVVAYANSAGPNPLARGDADLILCRNGDAAKLIHDDPDIAFVVPREGSLIETDNLCIAKRAKQPKNAHALINHLIDQQSQSSNGATRFYPTTLSLQKGFDAKDQTESAALALTSDILSACEFATYRPDQDQPIFEAFARVRASA